MIFGRLRPLSCYPLEKFKTGRKCRIDLAPYINRFKGSAVSPDPFKYSLVLSHGEGVTGGGFNTRFSKFDGVYRDAAYGFILMGRFSQWLPWRKVAGAVITFETESDAEKGQRFVTIKQIQGVKGYRLPFRWEKVLVQIVVDWARAQRFNSVRIIQGKNHNWFAESRKEQFRMHYDVTAKRMGFKYSEELQQYVLAI